MGIVIILENINVTNTAATAMIKPDFHPSLYAKIINGISNTIIINVTIKRKKNKTRNKRTYKTVNIEPSVSCFDLFILIIDNSLFITYLVSFRYPIFKIHSTMITRYLRILE